MDKFSKMKSSEYDNEKKNKADILYQDDYIKVIKYDDWSIIQEHDVVVCIPYLIEQNKFIMRQEPIPSFKYADGQELHVTLVGGAIEQGEDSETALIRELQEEAGIVLRDGFKIEFEKPLFMTKAHVNKYYCCILNLSENDYHEVKITGDGTKVEDLSKTFKIDTKYINAVNSSDLVTEYMVDKLKKFLNL